MREGAGGGERVLGGRVGDQRGSGRDGIDDVAEFHRLEIQHFCEVDRGLGPGKCVGGAHWVGREEAEAEILRSVQRAKDAGVHHAHGANAPH